MRCKSLRSALCWLVPSSILVSIVFSLLLSPFSNAPLSVLELALSSSLLSAMSPPASLLHSTPLVYFSTNKTPFSAHSSLKWPLEEIYNLIFEHLEYSAILVPNWNTWQKYFSWKHFSTEMIETFWGGKEDASLARNNFLGCQETLKLLEKG